MTRKKAGFIEQTEEVKGIDLPVDVWLSADEANRLIREEGYSLFEVSEDGYKVSK